MRARVQKDELAYEPERIVAILGEDNPEYSILGGQGWTKSTVVSDQSREDTNWRNLNSLGLRERQPYKMEEKTPTQKQEVKQLSPD